MSVAGTKDTGSVVGRKYDVANVVSLLNVGRYPLLGILTNAGKDPVTKKGKAMKKKVTTDPEFKWFEDTFGTRALTAASGTNNLDPDGGSFNITAGQGLLLSVGDLIHFPSLSWTFEVTGISTDAITVGAELGGATGSASSVTSVEVYIVGNANEEGAGIRTLKTTTATEKTGYCQIFRTPFGITNTANNTTTFISENDLSYQRRKKGIEHMVDIERAFFFGKKAKITSGSHPKRYTMGIIDTISTYATANVDTEAEFETFLESAFAYGNTEKYAFCSAAFVSQINVWAKNKLMLVDKADTYGVQIVKYVSPHGVLNIIKHELLTGTTYGNYCVVLDLEALSYRFLQNRDTKLLTNRQSNDEDQTVEEYLSEVGLQMEQESRHAICSKGSL